ncbi:MAG: ferredoxin-thioredoxin reductase catalytic domain-containing protein [Desulfobacteraceae bacterium]|jgi:ferredoxin-thioredoxin reductase catalytic subunit
MDEQALFDMLKPVQEKKGYYFNKNRERTFDILKGLITNKNRYGYMACPCRLASGERDEDKDIICPCVYREPDVKDFGTCYCHLYVSEASKDDEDITKIKVPERRPKELMV